MIEENLKIAEKYHQKACDEAYQEMLRVAREIMKEEPDLVEFVNAMGGWFFVPNPAGTKCWWCEPDEKCLECEGTGRMKPGDTLIDEHRTNWYPVVKKMVDFIDKWNDEFHLTGIPVRISAGGRIIRNW
jgi:hypothetical protein